MKDDDDKSRNGKSDEEASRIREREGLCLAQAWQSTNVTSNGNGNLISLATLDPNFR